MQFSFYKEDIIFSLLDFFFFLREKRERDVNLIFYTTLMHIVKTPLSDRRVRRERKEEGKEDESFCTSTNSDLFNFSRGLLVASSSSLGLA